MSAQVSLISSRENQNMFLGSVQETSVEQCEAFLDHLPCELGDALELYFGAQLQGDQVLGAGANAMSDIVASDHQVLAAVVATADDDMRVRVTSIEMIDPDPVELGAKVLFHLLHEIADHGLEFRDAITVLGRDYEAKLMRILRGALEEGISIGLVGDRIIEAPRIALAGDAVALDVAQVRARCAELTGSLARIARPDDDAARAGHE